MSKTEQEANVNSVSRISEGTTFKGEITSPHDIRIDGTFDGTITTQGRVVIGESARVSGEVACNDVDIWGNLEGTLKASGTLSLRSGCVVKGDVAVGKLYVELGSVYNGSCSMNTEPQD